MNKKTAITKNIGCAFLYFYVHFVTEVLCFYQLSRVSGDSIVIWFTPLLYDALAFMPQSLIGRFSDRFPKIPAGLPGIFLLSVSTLMFSSGVGGKYLPLVMMCLGNVCTHINGAEVTLRSSEGRLSHSAIFVAGGSFGVISGKLLANSFLPQWVLAVFALTAIPFVLLAEYSRKEADEKNEAPCSGFTYHSEKLSPALIIILAVTIVAVRGYMGYGIPTSWNKTVFQTVLLYFSMGFGKALGGVCADLFGVKKTALISSLAALPFLLCGNEHMIISLFGVFLFSMTMSITLALLVSVLNNAPGLAFGLTTIGLFLGSAPIFFFRLSSLRSNCIVITVLTLLCAAAFAITLRKDEKSVE